MVRRAPVLSTAVVVIVLLLFALPLAYMLGVSFLQAESYYRGELRLTLANLARMADARLLRAVAVSCGMALVGGALSVVLTVAGAYGLFLAGARRASGLPPAGRAVLAAALALLIFHGGVIPFYMVVRHLGLVNSYAALFVPYLLQTLMVLYCLESLRKIPFSLVEAARMDGAGDLQVFARVVLPLRIRVFLALFLVHFVLHWNNWYAGVLFIHSTRKQPVQLLLRNLLFSDQGFRNLGMSGVSVSPPEKMAAVLLSILPVALAYAGVLALSRSRPAKPGPATEETR